MEGTISCSHGGMVAYNIKEVYSIQIVENLEWFPDYLIERDPSFWSSLLKVISYFSGISQSVVFIVCIVCCFISLEFHTLYVS